MTSPQLLEIRGLPEDTRARAAATRAVALALGVPLGDASALLDELPVLLPLEDAIALDRLALELARLGATSAPTAGSVAPACEDHPNLRASTTCASCAVPLCAVCRAGSADRTQPRCARCAAKRDRSRVFYFVRVAVLLVILLGVVLYAWQDISRREARNDWTKPVRVAIILVAREPLDEEVGPRARERAVVLAAKLDAERRRHGETGIAPFSFQVFGPVPDAGAVPDPPEDDGLVAATRYAWDLHRFTSRIDDAASVNASGFDSRIYVLATRPVSAERKVVEGASQQGGRVGVVKVELDGTMIDLALFVATHELFHTLGATDRYDTSGQPIVPDGLPEPDRKPRFPQRLAEVMGRTRATGPSSSVPPKTLDELFVGELTARELRWR